MEFYDVVPCLQVPWDTLDRPQASGNFAKGVLKRLGLRCNLMLLRGWPRLFPPPLQPRELQV